MTNLLAPVIACMHRHIAIVPDETLNTTFTAIKIAYGEGHRWHGD